MIVLAELPRRRAVICFHFRDDPPPKYSHYWLVVEPGANFPELRSINPGRDVDLYVETGVVPWGPSSRAAPASRARRKGAVSS
jgi:hypothetical protein